MLGGIFHLHSNFERTFCKQTVETLVRCRVTWRLIWVCNVCLQKGRYIGIYGLTLFIWETPKRDTFTNSEDPAEIPHNLLRLIRSSDKKIRFLIQHTVQPATLMTGY